MGRGGARPGAGRTPGVKEYRPRKPRKPPLVIDVPPLPPDLLPAELAKAGLPTVPQTLQERLIRYSDLVEGQLLGMISDEKTPAAERLAAINCWFDRTHGPVPRVAITHDATRQPLPADLPRFGFKSTLPVMDVVPNAPKTVSNER